MSTKVILFDLDGTLIPMDAKVFVGKFTETLGKKLAPSGYDDKLLLKAIWGGIDAMKKHDGSVKNEEIFRRGFATVLGDIAEDVLALLDEYYRVEFNQVKEVCGFDSKAAETVRACKKMGYRVVLATNPVFPSVATENRMRWAGLEPEDFEFFTVYENSSFCKPNLDYYREIIDKLGVTAEECLMVGNDVTEDMVTTELGMKVFLLTRDLINKEEKDISVYPQGDYDDLLAFVKEL